MSLTPPPELWDKRLLWRSALNSDTWNSTIAHIVGDADYETLRDASLRAGFGWRRDTNGHAVAGLPGYSVAIDNPTEIVRAYRGMRITDERARDIFEHGETRILASETSISDRFLDASLPERSQLIHDEYTARIRGMWSGESNLIGASLDRAVANRFGTHVFELEIPREALHPLRQGDSRGEREVVTPFAIPAAWIKRVTTPSGQLAER